MPENVQKHSCMVKASSTFLGIFASVLTKGNKIVFSCVIGQF